VLVTGTVAKTNDEQSLDELVSHSGSVTFGTAGDETVSEVSSGSTV
jgi:hypothetical protein